MTVYVHRNLHHGGWSILHRGKVIARRNTYVLRDVEFRVRPGGHARAVREGKRNVHAFCVGEPSRGLPVRKPVLVRYDIRRGKFLDHNDQEILGAQKVRFGPEGIVQAFRPTYA